LGRMAQGRWKEAEELFVQVIKMRKRVLGEEHPDTLTSIDVQESRPMEGGRRARGASNRDEFEGARRGASFHADQYG